MKLSRRQIPINSSSKKSTYFEKYRRQLQKITNQIEIENMKASVLIQQSRMQKKSPDKSPQRSPEMRQSVIVKQTQSFNYISNQLLTPPLLALPDPEIPLLSRTSTESESSPATRRISGPAFSAFPSPEVTSRRVSVFVNSSSDKSRDETPTHYRQSHCGHHRKDSEVPFQINSMTKSYQELKSQLQKDEAELQSKKTIIDSLKAELSETDEVDYMKCIVNYAQKIIMVEQKIRENKKRYEDELKFLSEQKNQIHGNNVRLLMELQSIKEEIIRCQKQCEVLETQSPVMQLQKQKKKLTQQISKLQNHLQIAEKKNNTDQQLQDISMGQFNKYKEAWIKRFVGQQIAQAEDHIKFSSSFRFQKEIQKKRLQLKQKKIEVMLRRKKIMELYKISEMLEQSIEAFEKQIKKINAPKRKFTIFDTQL